MLNINSKELQVYSFVDLALLYTITVNMDLLTLMCQNVHFLLFRHHSGFKEPLVWCDG